MPKAIAKFLSLFIKEISFLIPLWGKTYTMDNSKSIRLLGTNYRDFRTALIDTAESIIELNMLKYKPKK